VVTSGAFVAVPVVWAAHLLRIPVVLHQLDVEVGLANRISCACSTVNTVTFAESIPEFAKRGTGATVIGSPVRRLIARLADPAARAHSRAAGRARWGFADRPTLLVLGGGTGAQELNDRVGRTIDELTRSVNVLHLTGKGKLVAAQPRAGYVAVEFLTGELGEALALADLAVTRAGLGTLADLCTAGVPSLIFPLAGHQEKNAALMEKAGAGATLSRTMTDREFVETVKRFMNDRDRRAQMTSACAALFPSDAAEKLAKIILQVAK
jgi:UDP-N-acetylglucosamine--N-acetylmuramyl-(pentapeptide) pyrophosphoryl-undecaprenol N-acetylglucosamine transferase